MSGPDWGDKWGPSPTAPLAADRETGGVMESDTTEMPAVTAPEEPAAGGAGRAAGVAPADDRDPSGVTGRHPASRGRLLVIALALIGLWPLSLAALILTLVSAVLVVVWVGLPMLFASLALVRLLARAHRALAARVLGDRIDEPYLPSPGGSFAARLRHRLTDGATWRDLAWLPVRVVVSFPLQLAVLLSYIVLPLAYFGAPMVLGMDAAVTRRLIGGSDERLRLRIDELERSRADSVDYSAAELRRIERDLHDGAQAQLVALGMSLGLAEEAVSRDPAMAQRLIAEARVNSVAALSELRSLVRGIHPPVLADRGLVGGLESLALAHPAPVSVAGRLAGRPPAPIESAVYFAVQELLVNAAKHSGAHGVTIDIRHTDGILTVAVTDDGIGGVRFPAAGGLAGLRARLAVFDGTLAAVSPEGGPTMMTITVPCELREATPIGG